MTPTLALLCRSLPGDLVPVVPVDADDRPVSAVHVSELVDPTPYLTGGELLLTTGLSLPETSEGCDDYVGRLKSARICALAIGLGPVHDEPPHRLVESCRSLGLPLLMVPPPTPFLAISRAFWSAVSRSTEEPLQVAVAAHRSLVGAASSVDPVAEILARLARYLDGWAAVLTAAGAVDQIAPAGLVEEAEALQGEVARLQVAGVHSAASFVVGGTHVVVHPLALEDQVIGYLAAGVVEQLDAAQRQVVLTAQALLSLRMSTSEAAASERRATRGSVALLVDLGLSDAAQRLAAEIGTDQIERDVRVLVARGRRIATLARVVEGWCGRVLTVTTAPTSGWFLLPAHHPPLAGLEAGIRRADPTASAVLTEPGRLTSVGAARAWASVQLGNVGEGRLELGAPHWLDTDELAHCVERFLAEESSSQVQALVGHLRYRGQWEAAARALGVHRNTLRYRVERARDQLGLDLDDPDVSARLWLLLRAKGVA